jgi:hypothetical protein
LIIFGLLDWTRKKSELILIFKRRFGGEYIQNVFRESALTYEKYARPGHVYNDIIKRTDSNLSAVVLGPVEEMIHVIHAVVVESEQDFWGARYKVDLIQRDPSMHPINKFLARNQLRPQNQKRELSSRSGPSNNFILLSEESLIATLGNASLTVDGTDFDQDIRITYPGRLINTIWSRRVSTSQFTVS